MAQQPLLPLEVLDQCGQSLWLSECHPRHARDTKGYQGYDEPFWTNHHKVIKIGIMHYQSLFSLSISKYYLRTSTGHPYLTNTSERSAGRDPVIDVKPHDWGYRHSTKTNQLGAIIGHLYPDLCQLVLFKMLLCVVCEKHLRISRYMSLCHKNIQSVYYTCVFRYLLHRYVCIYIYIPTHVYIENHRKKYNAKDTLHIQKDTSVTVSQTRNPPKSLHLFPPWTAMHKQTMSVTGCDSKHPILHRGPRTPEGCGWAIAQASAGQRWQGGSRKLRWLMVDGYEVMNGKKSVIMVNKVVNNG